MSKIRKICKSGKRVMTFTVIIFISVCLEIVGEKLSSDCVVGTDVVISQSVSGEGVVNESGNNYYVPGKTIRVTISFSKSSVTLYALGLESLIPSGWKYLGLVPGDYNPSVAPSANTISDGVNPLGFAWITTMTLPEEFSMSYDVEVSEGEAGEVEVVSRGLYRLTGGQICTNTETVMFVGSYSVSEGEGSVEGDDEGEGVVEGEGGLEGEGMMEGEGMTEAEGSIEGEGSVEGSVSEGEGLIEGSLEGGKEGEGQGEVKCGCNFFVQGNSSNSNYCGFVKGGRYLSKLWDFGDVLILLGVVGLLSLSKES